MESAIEVLSDLRQRPTSEQALGLLERDIIQAAEDIRFPVDMEAMKRILPVQNAVLPLVENLAVTLLKENEKDNPTYYPLARDCELFYDIIWGLGQATGSTLQQRLHLAKTSLGMRDNKNAQKYFNRIGITNKVAKRGPPMVFLDSGFRGSLFYSIAQWAKLKEEIPHKNFRGYLICCDSGNHKQLEFKKWPEEERLGNLVEAMNGSPYKEYTQEISLLSKKAYEGYWLYHMICAFMQLMPKFTGRYVKSFQRSDGAWDVMPEQNTFVKNNGLKISSNEECVSQFNYQKNSLDSRKPLRGINEDIVHPAAALILQKRTLEYFSDPNVHDRIYTKAKVQPH